MPTRSSLCSDELQAVRGQIGRISRVKRRAGKQAQIHGGKIVPEARHRQIKHLDGAARAIGTFEDTGLPTAFCQMGRASEPVVPGSNDHRVECVFLRSHGDVPIRCYGIYLHMMYIEGSADGCGKSAKRGKSARNPVGCVRNYPTAIARNRSTLACDVQQMQANHDHVIIGSGINALVAAAMLSGRRGRKLLLLEREDRLGGCMLSSEATLPGFFHDVMAASFTLFRMGPAAAALQQDLERHGLQFCHSPQPTAALRPAGGAAILSMDRAANIAAFNNLAPGDGDRFASDMAALEADAPLMSTLLGSQLWSLPVAGLLIREAWRRGLRGLGGLFGTALAPARGWLENGYLSPEVQALLAPWVLHCGLSPEDAMSSQMNKVVALALETVGAPIVKGGVGVAVEAFRRLIVERGGTVRTGADVEEILVRRGRAVGVRLAGGEILSARRSVIASVAPGQLYERLLGGNAPQYEKAAAQAFRHGRGNFQLHYALDRPPRWGVAGLEKVALIHLTDGIDAVSRSHNEATRGLLPAIPTLCVGQPSSLDPSRCPAGKATLWVQVPDAPRHIKGDATGLIATENGWDVSTREAFANRIEAILASQIAGFTGSILARRAYSPADLEAMNINLIGGDPYGGACTLDQSFLWRPFPVSVNHRTSIRGLYHIGASTHPGPGLSGSSGLLVVREVG